MLQFVDSQHSREGALWYATIAPPGEFVVQQQQKSEEGGIEVQSFGPEMVSGKESMARIPDKFSYVNSCDLDVNVQIKM